jgi:hypothetical protein
MRRLLGARRWSTVPVNALVGADDREAAPSEAVAAVAAGFAA